MEEGGEEVVEEGGNEAIEKGDGEVVQAKPRPPKIILPYWLGEGEIGLRDHLEQRFLDQRQAWASYTPLFGGLFT